MRRLILLALLLPQCASVSAQQESCYAEADARKIARAFELCEGLHWDECPHREEIRVQHRKEMRACRPGK